MRHYEIASTECTSCGAALTDDEIEQVVYAPDAPLVCDQCHEDD